MSVRYALGTTAFWKILLCSHFRKMQMFKVFGADNFDFVSHSTLKSAIFMIPWIQLFVMCPGLDDSTMLNNVEVVMD